MPGVLGGVVAGGDKVAPSPNKVLAVACCKLMHDPKGNTAFVCRYPACDKSYASRDAVRKHCRIHHLQWLRTLERVTTHEEEMVEVTLPVRTLKKAGEKGEKKPKAGALTAGDLASFVGLHGVSPDFSGLGGNPFSPSLHALPSADDLFDSLPIDLLNPDELMSGVDALAHEPMTPRTAALTGCVGNPGLISLELAASSLMSDPAGYTPRSSSALAAVQQTLAAELAAIPSAACAACSSGGSFPGGGGGGGGGRALHDALHAPGAPSANTTPATSVVSSSPLYRALGFGAREGKAVSGHDLGSTSGEAMSLSNSMAGSPLVMGLGSTPRSALYKALAGSSASPCMSSAGVFGTGCSNSPLGYYLTPGGLLGSEPPSPSCMGAGPSTPRSSLYAALASPDCNNFTLGSSPACVSSLPGKPPLGSMAAPPARPPSSAAGGGATPASGQPPAGDGSALRMLLGGGSGLF